MPFKKPQKLRFKQQQAHPKYPPRGTRDKPVYFNHPVVIQNIRTKDNPNGWADPFWDVMTENEQIDIIKKIAPCYGALKVESRNFEKYNGPLNPMGRTGMIGRGLLGCYGPNYAADPIVTRFKDGILEMVAIQRGDTGEWAIPGGMVERGATVNATLRNEFNEEALGNTLGTGNAEYNSGVHNCSNVKSKEDSEYIAKIASLQEHVDKLFKNGTYVYKGWVDDPRNTDWAWMETTVVHFHIPDDSPIHNIELRPATDATGAKWYKIADASDLKKLYASHGEFVLKAIKEKTKNDKWSNVYAKLTN